MNIPDRILDGLAIGLRAGLSGTPGDKAAQDGSTPFDDVMTEVSATSGSTPSTAEADAAPPPRGSARLNVTGDKSAYARSAGAYALEIPDGSAADPTSDIANGSIAENVATDTEARSKKTSPEAGAENLLDLLAVPARPTNARIATTKDVSEQTSIPKQVNMSSIDKVGPDVKSGRSAATQNLTSGPYYAKPDTKIPRGSDTKASETRSVSEMIDRLAKGADATETDVTEPKTNADAKPDKRSDADAQQQTSAGNRSDGATPPNLLAMLMQSAGVPAFYQAAVAPGTQAASLDETEPLPRSNDNLPPSAVDAAAKTAAGLPSEERVAVTDLSIATHFAPAPPPTGGATEDTFAASDSLPALPTNPGATSPDRSHDGDEPPRRESDTPTTSKDAPVSSVTTETHQTSVSPIVERIATAVTDLVARASVSVPAQTSQPSQRGPAQTMSLRIEQAGSGPIDIKMHMSGGRTLDLQLTVSDRQTLSDLSRDRDALTSALDDRNYHLNTLVIQDNTGAPASGGSHVGSGESGSSARQDTQSSEQKSNERGGGSTGRDTSRQEGRNADRQAPRDSSGNRRGKSLFV